MKRFSVLLIGFLVAGFLISNTNSGSRFKDLWPKLSDYEKQIHLIGFINGVNHAIFIYEASLDDTFVESEKLSNFKTICKKTLEIDINITEVETISEVIDGFYKDSANAHIHPTPLIYVAWCKIKGESESSINTRLEGLRSLYHEFQESDNH